MNIIYSLFLFFQIQHFIVSYNLNYFNNWNCIGIIDKINFKKPYKVNIGELPLVVWKGENNEIYTAINICKHMGSILDNGKIKNNNLQCQYHGLEYTKDDAIGKTIIHEGKLFWAYEPTHKTPHNVPFFNNNKYVKSFLEIEMDCSLKDSVFNTMDLLHPEYVHNNVVGFGSNIPVENIKNHVFKTDNNRLGLSFTYNSNDMMKTINNNAVKTDNFNMFIYPNFGWSRVTFDKKNNIIIGVNFLPITPQKTKWFVTICHNYYTSILQREIMKMMTLTILSQDFFQLKNQYPDGLLKNEILFNHIFKNERIIVLVKNLIKDYKYPSSDICCDLYKDYVNKKENNKL